MVSIYPPEAKAVLLLLTSEEELAEKVISHFEKILGPVEFKTPWHIFNHTPYYEEELGPNLKRCLISFKNIFEPEKLPELKNASRKLESELAMGKQRTINIDPGYVDLFKFLLASGKAGGQKVALAKDVYAYTLLRFEKGIWQPFEWTYPDFKESTYHPVLLEARESLKREIAGFRLSPE
ncbi:MAG: DUF4416 family protein [Deltaproteobacteria bacterium]|nr:DUF4416 family protein [Deltaproteobacteria bacterium]